MGYMYLYHLICSSPRYLLFSYSLVHSKKSYLIGNKPQLKKELFEVCVVCKKRLPVLELWLSTVRQHCDLHHT